MKNEEYKLLYTELALFLLHAELADDFDIRKVSTYHEYHTDY